MTFLAPAAGILGAAIALPVLALLYLLRLRRRPLRVSSTMLWEQAAQDLQVNVPLRMMRWSWLLILHLLALACFLLAIARPAIGEGGVTGSRVVIIVDRSASMNATDLPPAAPGGSPRSRLEAAKRKAVELIGSIGRSGAGGSRPRCLIVTMAASPRALTTFTTDLRTLREAVESVTPSDQPDDFAATLRLIDAMTSSGGAEETASPDKPTVFVVTDGVIEFPTATQLRGLRPVLVSVIPAADPDRGDERPDNVGIAAISARRDAEDPNLIRVFARLINAGPTALTVAARCTVDGQMLTGSVVSVDIPPAKALPGEEFAPGETAAVFALRTEPVSTPRAVLVSIARSDVLAGDDAGGAVVPPARRPRILIVVPNPSSPEQQPEPDVFLLQALEAADPASVRVIPAGMSRPAPVAAGEAAPNSPWADAEIVVFDRVAPAAGMLPGVPTLSVGAALPDLGVAIEPAPGPASVSRALAWRRDHPALRYVGLDTLLVAPGVHVELPEERREVTASSLVDGTRGPLVVEVVDRRVAGGSVRRLVVAFDLMRSNWGPDISFPLFVGNAVEYLTTGSAGEPSRSFSTLDTVGLTVPGPEGAVVVSGAQAFEVPIPAGVSLDGRITVGPLERAGLYQFRTTKGQPVDPAIAMINMSSERESSLFAPPTPPLPPALAEAASGGEGGPREIWHWFILASLLPLTVEWFVYAWRMRG